MKKVLILNGSPHGRRGNCQKVILKIQKILSSAVEIEIVSLSDLKSTKSLLRKIEKSQGLVFVTGTYWDSWGSPLQRFLEESTDLEGTQSILGKPCAVIVLMHSVGGKSILSRLQGVLSSQGFLIPPMTGMVHSMACDLALKKSPPKSKDDFWSLEDLSTVLSNFLLSLDLKIPWKAWPVDRKNFKKAWVK